MSNAFQGYLTDPRPPLCGAPKSACSWSIAPRSAAAGLRRTACLRALRWARDGVRAGPRPAEVEERRDWHDLRHTAVALAIATGTDAKAISARFGHSSIAITFDRYGHLMPGTDDALAAGLDLAFRSDNVVPFRRQMAGVD